VLVLRAPRAQRFRYRRHTSAFGSGVDSGRQNKRLAARTEDVVRSTATSTDRAQKYALKATGAKLSPLFNGSEQPVGITALPFSYPPSLSF
jgi:hypothetical protein